MKNIHRLSIIAVLYYSILMISACCVDEQSILNGKIRTAILSDYDVMPEAINNDVIKTGFRLTLFPETDIVNIDLSSITQVYGQDCQSSVTNSIINSTAEISFSKNISIGNTVYEAGSNLLSESQFQSIEVTSDCAVKNFCEIIIGFPTMLISTMSVEDGPITINFKASTDDNVSFDYNFETMIDLL